MRYLITLLFLSVNVTAQYSDRSYANTIEMRDDQYPTQGLPMAGTRSTVDQTRVNGVIVNKKIYYHFVDNNVLSDDSINVIIASIYSNSLFAWVIDTPIAYAVPRDSVTWMATKTNVAAKEPIIAAGTTGQYWRWDKTWVAFPTIPTNNNQLTNGSNYFVTPSGTTGQVVLGNGTLATFPATKYLASFALSGIINKIIIATMSNGDTVQTPVLKIPVSYSGTTNASGLYTVTFATAYSTTPNIQANVIGQGTEVQSRIVSVSTTGFSVHVFQRVAVLTLALSTATTNVSGATVHAVITEN